MLKPNEVAENWKEIVSIFRDFENDKKERCSKYGWENMVGTIISKLTYENAIETFAVISAIKKNDARIYGLNRVFMRSVPFIPEAAEYNRYNPVIYAGLDDIHTTYINRIITILKDYEKQNVY